MLNKGHKCHKILWGGNKNRNCCLSQILHICFIYFIYLYQNEKLHRNFSVSSFVDENWCMMFRFFFFLSVCMALNKV